MNQPSVLLLEILESVLSRFIYILVCVWRIGGGNDTLLYNIYYILHATYIYIYRERERKKKYANVSRINTHKRLLC